jgi:hypothetical protein
MTYGVLDRLMSCGMQKRSRNSPEYRYGSRNRSIFFVIAGIDTLSERAAINSLGR